MAPLDPGDYEAHYRADGTFTSFKKLVPPGQSVEVEVLDITKHRPTKYPVKDKDYCMRVSLRQGQVKYLMDINGGHAIGQFVAALYPKGPQGGLQPCRVKITRRTERSKAQSEVIIERVEAPQPPEAPPQPSEPMSI